MIKAASVTERFLYERSDAVTVLSDDLKENVVAKLERPGRPPSPAPADRVVVIPNFVDTERIRPAPRSNSYREEFGLGDRVVVMYAGNLGFSQSVDLLIDSAAALSDDPDVVFVVNGGGAAREHLIDRARGLDNVVFAPMQPKERLPEVLAAGDLHTILLKEGLGRSSVPSKLYSILAAGRPCVASIDPGTEVTKVLHESGSGESVAPGDAEALTKTIRRMVSDPAERALTGERGRDVGRALAVPGSGRRGLRRAVLAADRRTIPAAPVS